MEPEQMVHMVNQIAIFFASYPREEAVAGVTDHLKKFWEPRMRRQIIQYVTQGGGGLHDLALEAVKRLQ
jgi:formate dehydrogenase subunit delta